MSARPVQNTAKTSGAQDPGTDKLPKVRFQSFANPSARAFLSCEDWVNFSTFRMMSETTSRKQTRCVWHAMRVPQTDSNCNFLHSRGLQSLSVLGAIADDSIFPTPANCQSTAVANSVASPEILWDDLVSMKASNPSRNSDLVMIPSCKIQLATGLRAIKIVRGIGTESTGKQFLRHVDLWMHTLEGWKTQNPIRPRWGPNVQRVLQLALLSGHWFAHGLVNSPEVPSITGKRRLQAKKDKIQINCTQPWWSWKRVWQRHWMLHWFTQIVTQMSCTSTVPEPSVSMCAKALRGSCTVGKGAWRALRAVGF